MPSIPHGTRATQKWAGCFIFAKPGLFCAESHPSPVPTPKGSSLERGKGREKSFSHGYNSCFRGCCVFILLSHLLITKLLTCETQQHLQPAFWILPLGIWLQPWQGAGSTTSSRREREWQCTNSQSTRGFPQEDFGSKVAYFLYLKNRIAKFQSSRKAFTQKPFPPEPFVIKDAPLLDVRT